VQAVGGVRTIAVAAMKIFISYSTKDRATAAALYRDLRKGGATAFQFEQSETAGTPAWNQIVDWIRECDVFVVLISASALKSTAVAEEIEIAHYCYINSERKKPAKIIPAFVEAKVEAPPIIQRMSSLDLMNYESGLPKLLGQLGLKAVAPAPKTAAPALPAIDFDKLAREHFAANPPSAKQKQIRADVRDLVTNYDELKPAGLPKKAEEQHVDSLVAGLMGKSPDRFADPAQFGKLSLDLRAPKLRREGDTLHWTAVLGAAEYVLERRDGELKAKEAYRGTNTSYKVPVGTGLFVASTFRVKATGGVFGGDSSWSNAVEITGGGNLFKPATGTPAAPKITLVPGPLYCLVSWTPVFGATSYALERSGLGNKLLPDTWESLYKGTETEFQDFKNRTGALQAFLLYRVKALGPWGETSWGH
jgi:TIR domain-containing protein